MADITYPNKQTGDQVTAAEMNEIKTAVNSKVNKNGTDRLITDAESSKLATISGTNTGDQDLSGLAPINNPTFTGIVGGITKSMVGLGNVDNTSDINKPVSTAQQTALDTKTNKLITINTYIDDHILEIADIDALVEMNKATAVNVTIPPNNTVPLPINTQILVSWYGAGQVTIIAGEGVTIRSDSDKVKISARYITVALIQRATDEWYLFGGLTL